MSTAAPEITNPFPGLRPFRENEEHLFFGREGQVDAMVNKLAAHHFLAVLGTSGSGKSSLVNCGLRPALHRGLMTHAGTAWRVAQFRPGRDPIRALADALAKDGLLFPPSRPGRLPVRQIVEDTLNMSKRGLVDIVQQARLEDNVNLLVVADQFEELFRYRQTGRNSSQAGIKEATAFVNLLLEAFAQREQRIFVVITMRSDFLGDCAQFAGLPEAINSGQYLVPRLTREERRAAVAGPVAVGGATISPVLLTRLINDVGDNPDQLSILQHALNRTWSYWANEGGRQGPLSLDHYIAIGTMAGALDKHAEERAFAELRTERNEFICERIFKTLTDMGTDARGIRRPTPFGILCAVANAEPADVAQVIEVFRKPSRSFLMPPAGEPLEAATVVDISHESLMRLWQRLDRWSHEEAESAHLYRRLVDTARRHAAGLTGLWRDPELQLALDWRKHAGATAAWAELYGGEFQLAMSFLDGSEAERARTIAREREHRERELEQAQSLVAAKAKSARLLRYLFAAAILAAIGGFILAGLADRERKIAKVAEAAAKSERQVALDAQERAWVAAGEAKRAQEVAVKLAEVAATKHGEAVEATKKAEEAKKQADIAREKAATNLERALKSQARSLIDRLGSQENPASQADYAPLWDLFVANDDEARYVLKELFTEKEAGKKAIKRGYAFRRSLIGFRGQRDAIVQAELKSRCYEGDLKDLYVMGTCIVLARGFYPVDPQFVLRLEAAFRNHWDEWGQETADRDSVVSNFLFLIQGLGSKGAALLCQSWFAELPKKPWEKAPLIAWTRAIDNLEPSDADAVARGLLASPYAGKLLQQEPKANPFVALAAATSSKTTAAIWEALLRDERRYSDPAWLEHVTAVSKRLEPQQAAALQRKAVAAYPAEQPRQEQQAATAIAQEILSPGPATADNQRFSPFEVYDGVKGEFQRRISIEVEALTKADSTRRDALTIVHRKAQGRLTEEVRTKVKAEDTHNQVDDDVFKAYQGYVEKAERQVSEDPIFIVLKQKPHLIANPGKDLKTIAFYMRQNSRALIDAKNFRDFVEVLANFPAAAADDRQKAMNELMLIDKSHQAPALCYQLRPPNTDSSAAYRLLSAWGDAVERRIVQEILQWPDCPPNGVFEIVRKLAVMKNESPKSLGDRVGFVSMEQFAAWARTKGGYSFPVLK